MTADEIIAVAESQVGYHEKRFGTPAAALLPFRNSYDGSDNWTKYHEQIPVAQGQAWCGFFLYWCFKQLIGSNADTTAFLHGIEYFGGGVDSWYRAFNAVGKWHYKNDGYSPKPGDAVIYSDAVYTYCHVELLVDVSQMPTYVVCVGGNTKKPDEPGSESDSTWVAKRTRGVNWSAFPVLGYCEIDYDGSPSGWLPDYMYYWLLHKKKKQKWLW